MEIFESCLSEGDLLRTANMIFVTVGNATQGFLRLLNAVDELAGEGVLKGQSVVVQSGSNSDFRSNNCVQRDFFPPDEFRELIDKADVVVCHGGAGTLSHVFQAGKIPVVMPRRKKYREAFDDQFELVTVLARENRVIPAFEPENLANALVQARQSKSRRIPAPPKTAIALIDRAIREIIDDVRSRD
jgi:UDP-N-acetylglucosamine transferase subunit ALG13